MKTRKWTEKELQDYRTCVAYVASNVASQIYVMYEGRSDEVADHAITVAVKIVERAQKLDQPK